MQKPQSKLILNPTILIFKEKTDSCSIWQSQLLSAPQKKPNRSIISKLSAILKQIYIQKPLRNSVIQLN